MSASRSGSWSASVLRLIVVPARGRRKGGCAHVGGGRPSQGGLLVADSDAAISAAAVGGVWVLRPCHNGASSALHREAGVWALVRAQGAHCRRRRDASRAASGAPSPANWSWSAQYQAPPVRTEGLWRRYWSYLMPSCAASASRRW